MTVTLPDLTSLAAIETVLHRADQKIADRAGDDPLPAETIAEFARVVQEQILPAAVEAAGPGEVERLRTEVDQRAAAERHQADIAAELRTHVEAHQKVIERQKTEIEMLREQLREANSDTAALADAEARAEVFRTERDAEATENKRLAALLEEARASAAESAAQLADARDRTQRRHVHRYPWTDPSQPPSPCSCGQQYPRLLRAEPPAVVHAGPDPWGSLFEQIRRDLKGWK